MKRKFVYSKTFSCQVLFGKKLRKQKQGKRKEKTIYTHVEKSTKHVKIAK